MIDDGHDAIRISSQDGSLGATVLAFGASLAEFWVRDPDGSATNVVVSLPTAAAFRQRELNPHLGAIAGRYANRIARSQFTIDGSAYAVAANEGANCLHGGPVGFSRRDWEVLDSSPGTVVLGLVSADGDQGFPGTVRATASYRLDGSSLHVELSATTDAPTVVNLTNHAYWNLAGAGDVKRHELRADAAAYLPTDDEQIPTGEIREVQGTVYDFGVRRVVGEQPVDHCLVLGGPAAGDAVDAAAGPTANAAAELLDPSSGRRMTLRTTEPGLPIYTGHKLRPPHLPFGGLAMEAQRFPDAPNRPAFGDVTLRPGERYEHHTTLTFG